MGSFSPRPDFNYNPVGFQCTALGCLNFLNLFNLSAFPFELSLSQNKTISAIFFANLWTFAIICPANQSFWGLIVLHLS